MNNNVDISNKNELIFIAKYPIGNAQKDGASIRFLAIDDIFKNVSRTYIESFIFPFSLLFYLFLKEIKHRLFLQSSYNDEKITSYKYLNKKEAIKLFENAKVIYIESYGNLIVLPPEMIKKYGNKMVFDLHGCSVEEAEMSKLKQWQIKNLKRYEELAFKYIKNFVVVSKNMKGYYLKKYATAKEDNFILLPIFQNNKIVSSIEEKDSSLLKVIYSGRNYVWQNAELMIDSVQKIVKNSAIPNANFTFLTPDINTFSDLAKKYQVEDYITFKSVAPSDLNNEYKNADLGFILRDDSIVNRVSCPTKLIEYLLAGIVPIVLQPEIGDFNNLGYKYILLSDFIKGNIPSIEELNKMREINYKVVHLFLNDVEDGKKSLLRLLERGNN